MSFSKLGAEIWRDYETDAVPASGAHAIAKADMRAWMAAVEANAALQFAVDVRWYGAVGDGVTDDRAAIKAALDAVGAAGGGTVYLPPGTYYCSNSLPVPSNTAVVGAGPASIVRGPAGALAGVTLSGVAVYGMFALTGVVGAAVRNLTLDYATNGTSANGIVVGSAGASVRSSFCRVENCRIYGNNAHEYLIWVQCADYNTVKDNRITGRINMLTGVPSTTTLDLAGIELYGGTGNIIEGNRVDYCGVGIAIVQESFIANCDLIRNIARNNIIDHCANGFAISNAETKQIVSLGVFDNIITASGNRGINFGFAAGSITKDVLLARNNVSGSVGAQIALDANGAAISASYVQGIVLGENLLSEGGNHILINGVPGVSIIANVSRKSGSDAIALAAVTAVTLLQNIIDAPGGSAVDLTSVTRLLAHNNILTNLSGFGFRSEDANSSIWEIVGNHADWAGTPDAAYRLVAGSNVASVIARRNVVSNAPTLIYDLGSGSQHDNGMTFDATGLTGVNDAAMPGELVRITNTPGSLQLNGISGGTDGAIKTIYNTSGTNTMTLAANNAGSIAANRLSLGASSSVTLGLSKMATFRYSGIDARWVLISQT